MHYSFLIPMIFFLIASFVQAATTSKGSDSPKDLTPKSIETPLLNSKNEKVGSATLTQLAKGVKIDLDAWSLPPGKHAIHIHEKGECTAPEFKSAGEHYNPSHNAHGFGVAAGSHLGDLPNIVVGEAGKVKAELIAANVSLSGKNNLLAQKGTAIVIHEKADDDHTQPSGDAGGRIACAEIKP